MTGALLVTGATGFVGRALIASLADEPRPVIALVRRLRDDLPAHVIQRIAAPMELLDQDGWLTVLEGVEVVVHLAAIAHIGPDVPEERYDAVNHRAVVALAEAAAAAGVRRIVFMSSIRAQTGAHADSVLSEATPPAPTDAYGHAKLAAEQALAQSGVDHVVLRPTVIVGNEAKGNLALLLRLADTPLPLPFATLSAKRSMVSLDDVVAITRRAIDDPAMAGGTFILADPEPVGFGEALAALRRGLGRRERLFAVPEMLLALPFRLLGRRDIWERVGAPLVARPDALSAIGYRTRLTARAALEALGRAAGMINSRRAR